MLVSNNSKNFAPNENIRYLPHLLNLAKNFELIIEIHPGRIGHNKECSNAVVRARSKKRLYAEEAPTNCGSRGQLSTISHYSQVIDILDPSLMTFGLIKIPFVTFARISNSHLNLNGNDNFHSIPWCSALVFVKKSCLKFSIRKLESRSLNIVRTSVACSNLH
ncbi:hypothetical protein V1478_012083 [Vespula squamosa]|uniref:Uncharacterized protein n=1 Tax=Vespula squamosa TaxID=30214 RepID=A0ABD2ACY2_VESSQ